MNPSPLVLIAIGALLLSSLFAISPAPPRPLSPLLGPTGAGHRLVVDAGAAGVRSGGVVSVSTYDDRALNNTALSSNLEIPMVASSTPAHVEIWLIEPLTSVRDAGVGIAIDVGMGTPVAHLVWATWTPGGLETRFENVTGTLPLASSITISIARVSGTTWSFGASGTNRTVSVGGSLDLGVRVADDLFGSAPPGLIATEPTLRVNSSAAFPFDGLRIDEAFRVGSGPTAIDPGDGVVTSGLGAWGIEGANQDPGIPPDTILESAATPALPNGTYVWGIGNANFRPLAAWTSEDPSAYSVSGAALNLTVPGGVGATDQPVGVCVELLVGLVGGPWITVGVCWVGGTGTRAYLALTHENGLAYQKEMFAPFPPGGSPALLTLRALGQGIWIATLNGQPLSDKFGNASIAGGSDATNASLGPYGDLRGYLSSDLPDVVTFPQAILRLPTIPPRPPTLQPPPLGPPILLPEGRIAPSDGSPPVYVGGHLQDPFLEPGAIEIRPSSPSLPFETALWHSASLPRLSLTGPVRTVAPAGDTPHTLVFAVHGATGEPISGASVRVSVPSGAGSIDPVAGTTGSNGTVDVAWFPPSGPGHWDVTVDAGQGNFSPASTTILLEVSGGFGPLSASVVAPSVTVLAASIAVAAFFRTNRDRRGQAEEHPPQTEPP